MIVCESHGRPAFAASAIIAFAHMSMRLRPVELRFWHPASAAHRFRAIFEPG
jgi:hypothetical protein